MSRLFIIILLVLVGLGIIILLVFYTELTRPQSTDSAVIRFEIEPGQPLKAIAKKLEREKLLDNSFLFETFVFLQGLEKKFLSGEHRLPRNLSVRELARALTSGVYLEHERVITIIEGWNLRDIGFYLENQGIAQAEELWEIAGFPAISDHRNSDLPLPKDFSEEFDFLEDKPVGVGLEGYLFPDTYRIFVDADVSDIVRKMLDNFSKKLTPEMRDAIMRSGHTLFEVLTVASIVEKEVRSTLDRPLVAGILWKRLGSGMPLQADSTVNYVTGGKSRALSEKELSLENLFNTYKYRGLPPTPISNSGLEALQAAIFPQASPYWYFLSREDGTTVFSRTFEEHREAKKKFL